MKPRIYMYRYFFSYDFFFNRKKTLGTQRLLFRIPISTRNFLVPSKFLPSLILTKFPYININKFLGKIKRQFRINQQIKEFNLPPNFVASLCARNFLSLSARIIRRKRLFYFLRQEFHFVRSSGPEFRSFINRINKCCPVPCVSANLPFFNLVIIRSPPFQITP